MRVHDLNLVELLGLTIEADSLIAFKRHLGGGSVNR